LGIRKDRTAELIIGVSPKMSVFSPADGEVAESNQSIKATPELLKLLSLRSSTPDDLIEKAGEIIRNMTRDYRAEVGGVVIEERDMYRVWDIAVGEETSAFVSVKEKIGFHSHPMLTGKNTDPIDEFDEDTHTITDLMLFFRNTPGYIKKKEDWQSKANIPRPPVWARIPTRRDRVVVFGPHYTVSLEKTDKGKRCVEFGNAVESTVYELGVVTKNLKMTGSEEKRCADMKRTIIETNFFPFREHLDNRQFKLNWNNWVDFCDKLSLKLSITEADTSKLIPSMTHYEKLRKNTKCLVPGTYRPKSPRQDFDKWVKKITDKSVVDYKKFLSSQKWKD
jgi:hypothetical protein